MEFNLKNEQEVLEMVESKEWWIFLGDQGKIDDLEEAAGVTFQLCIGPPVGPFKRCFPGPEILPVSFAKKSDLPLDKLTKALKIAGAETWPESESQDVLWIP